jgi:hypothetical protein
MMRQSSITVTVDTYTSGRGNRQDHPADGIATARALHRPLWTERKRKKGLRMPQNPRSKRIRPGVMGVRHQGLEPRTRWLRERVLGCRAVPSDVGQDLFGWSPAITCVELYRVLSTCARPLGLFSGTCVPDSVEVSGQVSRAEPGSAWGLSWRSGCCVEPEWGRDSVLYAVTVGRDPF